MNEKNLNIKEAYSLILSNIENKYKDVFINNKLLKIENEIILPEIKLLEKENNEDFKKDLSENIEEYSLYDLPLYYAKHDDKMKDKYNEFIIKSFESNSYKIINSYYSYYIGKENDLYYKIKIKSDSSLINYLEKTIKEEDLELLYNIEKEEITNEEFDNLLNIEIEKEAITYFENMGLKLFTKENDLFGYYLNNKYNEQLENSIYKYIFNKNEQYIIKELEEEFKKNNNVNTLEYFIKLIREESGLIDNKVYGEIKYLKNIFINILNNDINSESLYNIKEYVNLAINDFDGFIKEHKGKIIESFNNLLLNDSNEKIKNMSFNDILKTNKNKKLTDNDFVNKIFEGHESNNDWYKLKCFVFETMFSNPIFFKDLKANSFENILNQNFSKRLGNKVYNIDFENKSILWSFINKEDDDIYQKEKKDLFVKLKQQYINENENITKDELREKLNPILSREVNPNEILNFVDYNNIKYQNSSLNNLKKIFETNIDLFQNNLNYSFKKFIEHNNIDSSKYFIHNINSLKENEKVLFNKNNHSVILNLLLDKHEISGDDKQYINKIIYEKDIVLNNNSYIQSLLSDFCNDKIKNAITEFIYTMEYKILSEINYLKNNQDSLTLNNSFFDDFYLFKKIMSVIKDFDINQKFYQFDNVSDESLFNKNNIESLKENIDFISMDIANLKEDFFDINNLFVDENNGFDSFFSNNKNINELNDFFDISDNKNNDKEDFKFDDDIDLDLTF